MALAAAREPLTNARAALLKLATEQLVVADELYPEVGPGAVGDDPFAPATPKNGQPPAPAPA